MRKSKIALLFLIISVAVIFYFTSKVMGDETLSFDQVFTSMFLSIFQEPTQPVFKFITIFGSKIGIGIIGISLIIWLWFKKKNFMGIVVVLLTVAAGNGFNELIKNWIKRPRPNLEHLVEVHSYSYPSGHAMVGIILYMVVGYFVIKEMKKASTKWVVGSLLGILVFLVGVSRIVFQVHYPSDIFAGFAFGYCWVYFNFVLYELFFDNNEKVI